MRCEAEPAIEALGKELRATRETRTTFLLKTVATTTIRETTSVEITTVTAEETNETTKAYLGKETESETTKQIQSKR